jgi:drug/metabolite transporter (DMT)-like permease
MVTTLMIVLILSAIILKERMRKRMVAGIILGPGTAFILYGRSVGSATNAGNMLVLINAPMVLFNNRQEING